MSIDRVIGASDDAADLRKARGAFFTPPAIASFIVDWAVREPTDRVLEPSAGEAEFLVHAVRRMSSLVPTGSLMPCTPFTLNRSGPRSQSGNKR